MKKWSFLKRSFRFSFFVVVFIKKRSFKKNKNDPSLIGSMGIDKQEDFISKLALFSCILCIQEHFLLDSGDWKHRNTNKLKKIFRETHDMYIVPAHSKRIQWSHLDGVKGVLLLCGRKDSQNIWVKSSVIDVISSESKLQNFPMLNC